jgi:hypothetical protein
MIIHRMTCNDELKIREYPEHSYWSEALTSWFAFY